MQSCEPIDPNLPPTINIPYVCSLSSVARKLSKTNPSFPRKFMKLAEMIVTDVDGNAEVSDSLKKPEDAGKAMRQVDIKDGVNQLMFKGFIRWMPDQQMWHVMLELAFENVWEKGDSNY